MCKSEFVSLHCRIEITGHSLYVAYSVPYVTKFETVATARESLHQVLSDKSIQKMCH